MSLSSEDLDRIERAARDAYTISSDRPNPLYPCPVCGLGAVNATEKLDAAGEYVVVLSCENHHEFPPG